MGASHADDATPSPTASVSGTAEPSPSPSPTEAAPTPAPTATPVAPVPNNPLKPTKQPRRKLPLRVGDFGPLISKAQQRLTWLGYTITQKTLDAWLYGDTTEAAVKKFQIKFWLKPTGIIDTATWKKLSSIAEPVGVLPEQCTQATTICADKTAKIIRYVVKGDVKLTVDARFGLPGMETGEGTFHVHQRDFDHTSTLYHTWMPRALFFNGDQAVHYSPYFAHDGYNGGSHGCIGIREMDKATWLFNQVPMGGRVYVYRS
jgi:hypothetical protein